MNELGGKTASYNDLYTRSSTKNRESMTSKKISNDQELIQLDPISYPQNQKGNN